MSLKIDKSAIPALVFLAVAMGLLIASVRTTTLAEKAADEARDGLIPADKASPAVDFTLPVVTSDTKSTQSFSLLAASKKTPVVFSFWAGYCQWCPLEMQNLERYSQQYKGKIQFYTVNSNDSPAAIRRYMAGHGFSLPVLSDAGHGVAAQYSVDSLPTLFAVDKQGRVRYYSNGYDPQMDTVFPRLLNALARDSG